MAGCRPLLSCHEVSIVKEQLTQNALCIFGNIWIFIYLPYFLDVRMDYGPHYRILTHSFIFAHILTHSLTHSLTLSTLTLSTLTFSLSHSLSHSLTHSPSHSLTRLPAHSLGCTLSRLHTHSPTRLYTHTHPHTHTHSPATRQVVTKIVITGILIDQG